MEETIKLYSLQEVADLFKVSKQSVYNWLKAGKIKAKKYGKEYRVTQEELNRLIKEGV